MPRFRFSIASLLGLILFVAVGIAALRAASGPWDSAMFGLTMLILMSSILLVVHRRGDRRAFWVGFALFGWIYLAGSLIPPIEGRFPTSKALAWLASKRPRPDFAGIAFADFDTDGSLDLFVASQADASRINGSVRSARTHPTVNWISGNHLIERVWAGGIPTGTSATTANFLRIGHSLIALVMACVGGLLSRSMRPRDGGMAPSS